MAPCCFLTSSSNRSRCLRSSSMRKRVRWDSSIMQAGSDKTLLREGIYQTAAGEPLLRGGGPATYFTTREEDRLEMHRP